MKRRAFMLAALATTVAAQAQTKWDLPTGYGVSTFQTQNVQQFADDVARATGGKLKIVLHPAGSLFKANEIKRAVQTGQVQIGEFILSGASNEHPLFGVDSIPFLATGYDDAKRLADASRAPLEKLLSSQGMKLLFTVPWPPQSLYSSKPVSTLSDLRGTKMRAYNPATSRIAQLAGAQPVTIQLAELPQALATGTVENFLTSSASAIESKLYEQVKYFYDVSAWLPKNAVVVHQQTFDALDKATQEAVVKVAADAQTRGWAISQQKDKEYLAELAAKGMQVNTTNVRLKQELKTIGERMTTEWLGSAGADGQLVIDAYRRP